MDSVAQNVRLRRPPTVMQAIPMVLLEKFQNIPGYKVVFSPSNTMAKNTRNVLHSSEAQAPIPLTETHQYVQQQLRLMEVSSTGVTVYQAVLRLGQQTRTSRLWVERVLVRGVCFHSTTMESGMLNVSLMMERNGVQQNSIPIQQKCQVLKGLYFLLF